MKLKELIESVIMAWRRLPIALDVMPIVAVVAIFKYLSHVYGFEVMELNYLFPSLVAGVVFLMSFLILGVFADYKESERKMSELSSTLRSLLDDAYTLYKHKNSDTAGKFIVFLQESFLTSLYKWFYEKKEEETIIEVTDQIRSMNKSLVSLDKEGIPIDYIIKMKTQLETLRDIMLRMETIRHTKFVGPAYTIVVIMCIGVVAGLIITEIQAFYISLFFTIAITFFIFFMLLLIKDLENPFEYYIKGVEDEKEYGTEISLRLIHEFKKDIKEIIEKDPKLKELKQHTQNRTFA